MASSVLQSLNQTSQSNNHISRHLVLHVFVMFLIWLILTTGIRTENGYCPKDCSCLGTFVDCSKKSLTKVPTDLPEWMGILDLSSNQLREVGMESERLPVLTELKLSKNLLTEIPSLNHMPKLSSLSLSHNEIQRMDCTGVRNISTLKLLDVSNNRLGEITTASFPYKSSIQILNLSSNQISSIEKGSLDNLPLLTDLRLNRNHLSKFKKGIFKELKHLRVLELNRNDFTEVEGLSFHGLEMLTVLRLRRNSIQTLYDGAFWGLKNMSTLQLDSNNITLVTKGWLYGVTNLHQLTLSNNRISHVEEDGWEFCTKLIELDLSNNYLEAIEKGTFEHLAKLQKLRLDNNRISYIAEGAFNNTPLLEILELNHNRISTTIEDMSGAFVGLNRLLQFGLADNHIKSITNKSFSGLERLKKLDLTGNNISLIQEESFSLLVDVKELLLNTSSLLCDCKMKWLPAWLETTEFYTPVVAICAYPEWVKGKPVSQVHASNFSCDDFPNPHIVEDPKTEVALKGSNVTLHCKANSSAQVKMTIQWKKDNLDFQGGNITNFARSPNGKGTEQESILLLSNITDKDTGKYQCVVSNEYGTSYSQKAKITVLIFPTFVKTPGNVTVKTKNTARLECAAKGQPPPEIAWQKDGGNDFPAARERRMHVMPTDDVFFIVNVKTIDMGTYSCTAQNPAGAIVANASLTVEEPPSFVKPMENKEIMAGEPIVLECMAAGSPKPDLRWRKDGKELMVTDRHFFTADDQLLVIVDTILSDAGSYECEMSNSLGKEQGSLQLSVIDALPPTVVETDMTGIIIITVVCCAVGTSVVWVVIIYQTRKRMRMRMAMVDMRTDECPYPNTLLATASATDDQDSAPHLYLDTNSEHSSGSKDSGTGDSAGKRSSDNLLLGNILNLTGGSRNSMGEEGDCVLLEEMSSDVDTITLPPVLRNNPDPRHTNHDRCSSTTCASSSKRWSDPQGSEQHMQPNSYHSLPDKTATEEECVPCITAGSAQ